MTSGPVYMDYQATTPLDPRVREEMAPYLGERFGNPHSVHHAYGWSAARAVTSARAKIASLLGAGDDEVILTSGATESCNIAVRGAVGPGGDRDEIVTLATEHPAVLESVRAIAGGGGRTRIVGVGPDGIVDLAELRRAVSGRTAVVSVMLVNNEIGVVQPVSEVAAIARDNGALMHTDATQAAGRMVMDVDALGVDLLSLSSHKMYGPMGIGALYVREEAFERLAPMVVGGGQERGLRSGTVPVHLAVGFGKACEIAAGEMETDSARIRELTGILWRSLSEAVPGIRLNGHERLRVPGNLNVSLPDLSGDAVAERLRESVAVSTGSACSSQGTSPSRVLSALGYSPAEALQGVRISLGRFTTEEDVSAAAEAFQGLGDDA